ncbi:rRNA maturation RNase YbeY [Candidatus Kaiserbacteria bacterium]|nr:rRNA maturation RNase YbeY [Candidatus Kaiserbacteria bacterium]
MKDTSPSNRLSITKTINGKLPRLPFVDIKESILGKNYDLSLVFIGDRRAKTLNQKYRKKDYVPDILSFPYDKNEGEIFINPYQAKRRAKDFEMDEKKFIVYLFIHGLLHLKGLRHGSTMDTMELAHLKRFYK